MYAATAENRKPVTTMISVMTSPIATLPTIAWYSANRGMTNTAMPTSTICIGVSRSVCATASASPRRYWCSPLAMPDTSEPRIDTSAQIPPTSIAPTPR